MTGIGAMAQDDAVGGGLELPAPEEVADIENIEEPEADVVEEEVPAETEAAEVPEAETTDIPEAEPTEAPETAADSFDVWFEEGFGLTLPEGWVSYAVSDEDKAAGIRYALGDGTGARNLYIQFSPTRIADTEGLSEAVENTEGLSKTGELTFGETRFVAFIDALQNASCCATLWGGDLAVFIFTPQTDSDFMLTASHMMESFKAM